MESKSLIVNFRSMLTFGLLKRVISSIFFVPAVFLSLYQEGVLIFILFIFFYIIILSELVKMHNTSRFKTLLYSYAIIATFSIIVFPYYVVASGSHVPAFMTIFILIWIFDSFSYLGGNLFKGRKIFPKISKGKTFSGLFSGIISVFFFNLLIFKFIFDYDLGNTMVISFSICLFSFVGDAAVSILKRQSDLKDTGSLFIGHGGFLDRMDSFIAVIFIFIIFNLLKFFS